MGILSHAVLRDRYRMSGREVGVLKTDRQDAVERVSMMSPKLETIMIVDDEEVIRDVLSTYLEKKGHKTVTLEDGLSAVDYAKKEKPDLVLLDIRMPGLDGIETCHTLRRMLPSSPHTGIMIITGHGSPVNIERAFNSGAVDVIKKPFDLEDINKRINIWFEVRDIDDELSRSLTYTEKVNWYLSKDN